MDSSHQKAVIESSLKLDSSEMTLNPLIQPLLVAEHGLLLFLCVGLVFLGNQKRPRPWPGQSESLRKSTRLAATGWRGGGEPPRRLGGSAPQELGYVAWFRTMGEVFVP